MHWGCGETFTGNTNKEKHCRFHPGRFEFGSVKGWWPEGWSCCREPWESLGCTAGFHGGIPASEQTFLCINYGEVGPDKIYPDSFCGSRFSAKKPGGCSIHTGYLNKNKIWTCCNRNQFFKFIRRKR